MSEAIQPFRFKIIRPVYETLSVNDPLPEWKAWLGMVGKFASESMASLAWNTQFK